MTAGEFNGKGSPKGGATPEKKDLLSEAEANKRRNPGVTKYPPKGISSAPLIPEINDIVEGLEDIEKKVEAIRRKIGRLIDRDETYRRRGEVRNIGGVKGTTVTYDISVKTLTGGRVKRTQSPQGGEWEPLVDVFDEKDRVVLVTESPGVKSVDDVKLYVKGSRLTLSTDAPSQRYHREVRLPHPVKSDPTNVAFKNGILAVELEKMRSSPGVGGV